MGGTLSRERCVWEQVHACTTNLHFPLLQDCNTQKRQDLLPYAGQLLALTLCHVAGQLPIHSPAHPPVSLSSVYPSCIYPSINLSFIHPCIHHKVSVCQAFSSRTNPFSFIHSTDIFTLL